MDDDIERAADQEFDPIAASRHEEWTERHNEQAVDAGVAAMMAEVRKYPMDRSSPVYGGSLGWGLPVEEAMRIGLRAAAAVIVPATAEHIAAAIERDGFDPGKYTLQYPGGNTLRVMGLVRDDCARIARAAGLSAGATGGDSDE